MMNYVGLCASVLPISLHTVGFFLLYLKGRNITSCQRIYLLNLSVAETFICTSADIYFITYYFDKGKEATHITQCFYYCSVLPFYVIMIALTAERFFELYLNIRFHLFWTTKSTKKLMIGTWISTLLIFVIIETLILLDIINSSFGHN